jgi:hypothetical protein
MMIVVGCSGDSGQTTTVGPSSTDPPEGQGTAVLVYVLDSNQKNTGFRASSDIGIPISMFIPTDNPKAQATMHGSNIADYFMRIPGKDKGKDCTLEFTYMVKYDVKGIYNPDPKCDFEVQITAEVVQGEDIIISGTCPNPTHEAFPAEGFIIPPPPGLHKIPGSLGPVAIRDDNDTKITLEMKNVVVPRSTGCVWTP